MKKTAVSHKPGDIVEIAGTEFVVLDPHMASSSDEEETLFVLAVDSVGSSQFGGNNNYAGSDLKKRVDDWMYRLSEKLSGKTNCDRFFKSRTLDLTTLDGHGKYGTLDVLAAPLTLDEARKYADVIPNPDEACWLATGWGGPEYFGSAGALVVLTSGGWNDNLCSGSYGIRPALVISSFLLDSDESDLSDVSTDDLMAEIRRRIGE